MKEKKHFGDFAFWMFYKVYLRKIFDSETKQKYYKKETLNFGRGRRTLLWFEI